MCSSNVLLDEVAYEQGLKQHIMHLHGERIESAQLHKIAINLTSKILCGSDSP